MFFPAMQQLLLVLVMVEVSLSANEHKIAIVTELHQDSVYARSLELFPDTLDVEVETDDGVEALHLVIQKSLNVRSIPVEYDDPELNQRKFRLTKDVAYYQDLNNMAPIKVEARVDGGAVKRILTGTMIHSKRAYEIHPGSAFLQSMADILEEKGLGMEKQHSVHVLKRVNLGDYLKPHEIKLSPDQEERRQEMEKEAREEKTLKTFLRLLSADDKDVDLKRSKRYATNSTTVFHVEMLFVIDYSVYHFWMEQHNNDTDEVHQSLVHYFTQHFNGIHMSFRRIDYEKHGIAIVLWLKKLHIITDPANEVAVPQERYQGQVEEDAVFNSMVNFLAKNNYDWTLDHAMLWTKSDLAADYDRYLGRLAVDMLGVAYLCRVCHPEQGLSINEDNGFFSWATGAHEFAHNIGSYHDGTVSTCLTDGIYIMYQSEYTLDGDIVEKAFQFSDCSVEQFKLCFAGKNENNQPWPPVCVYDTVCDHNVPLDSIDVLPGREFNLTEQCQMFVDPTSSPDLCQKQNAEICEKMMCYIPSEEKCSNNKFKEFRAAQGTPCNGSSRNSVCTGDDCVCYEGRCMDADNIKTIEHEPKPSCSDVKYEPPTDCINDLSNDTCERMVLTTPWRCFTSAYYKENCKASCYEYGLFYVENPPCHLSGGVQVPASETPTKVARPLFCQQTENGREGGMTCPGDPGHCIPMSWFCDGEEDCFDGTDEIIDICQQVPCSVTEKGESYLRCRDDPSYCFRESDYNDGYDDCPNGSDEDLTWFQTAPRYCYKTFSKKVEGFNCPNNHTKCVLGTRVCDGVDDCVAGEGEMGDESIDFCDGLNCMKNQLRCPNAENDHSLNCIKKIKACSGKPHCPNGEDELISWCLANGVEPACEPEEAICPGVDKFWCFAKSWACDSEEDCEGGGDEIVEWCEQEGMPPSCEAGQIMCPDKSKKFQCIERSSLCDGRADCPGAEDENQSFCLTQGCQDGQVACPGHGPVTCLDTSSACDGKKDCPGGVDENQAWCNKFKSLDNCASDEVLCPNAESPDDCVSIYFACDDWNDCSEGADEDEDWCETLPPATCRDDEFQCTVNSFRCIPSFYKCDDIDDCNDDSDENAELCGEEKKEISDNKKILLEAERALRKLKISSQKEQYRQQKMKRLQAVKENTIRQNTRQILIPSGSALKQAKAVDKVDNLHAQKREEEELTTLLEKILRTSSDNDDGGDDGKRQINKDWPEHKLYSLKEHRQMKKDGDVL